MGYNKARNLHFSRSCWPHMNRMIIAIDSQISLDNPDIEVSYSVNDLWYNVALHGRASASIHTEARPQEPIESGELGTKPCS